MDINTLRSIATVVMFAVFIAIVIWAWSRKNQAAFDEAAMLPFQNDDAHRENNG
jgi:cytochrome c oxidase cbb3-type subunit 4